MGFVLGKSGTIIVMLLLALVDAIIFMPQVRTLILNFRAETVTISVTLAWSTPGSKGALDLKIGTILGCDGIPAILDLVFAAPAEALAQLEPSERVLGVAINGDHRAYPLNLLSRHEIVNDTVDGKPISVTW